MKFLSRALLGLIFLTTIAAAALSQGYPQPIFNNDIRGWGCKPSLADNGPCINNAIVANANGAIHISGGLYPVITPIVANTPVEIIGDTNSPGIYSSVCVSGLAQAASNIDLITLTKGGTIQNLCIAQSGTTNTAGHAIFSKATTTVNGTTRLYNNQINGACWGIGITGTGVTQNLESTMIANTIIPAANNSCGGFIIGENSTGGNTVDPRLTNNSVYCGTNTGTALKLMDSGGAQISGNVFGFQCNYGTVMIPGAGQSVQFTQASIGPLGDTSNTHDLYIDTSTSTSILFGNYFNGTWASNSQNGASVYVRNTGASPSTTGLYFRGFVTYSSPTQSGFDIGDSWQNVFIQDSTICTGGPNTKPAVSISGSVGGAVITGNKFGTCDNFVGGTQAIGVSVTSSSQDLGIIADNKFGNLVSPMTTPISWAPTGAINFLSTVVNSNWGIDNVQASATASGTVTLPMNPTVFMLGTATVQNLVGPTWTGRQLTLISQGGTVTYAIGGAGQGALCNGVTATPFTTVTAIYNGANGCWFMK